MDEFHLGFLPFQHRVFDVTVYDILASVGLALLVAVFAVFFIRLLKFSSTILERLLKSDLLKALLGGLMVGGCVVLLPHVRGEGYEVVRSLISGDFSMEIPLILVLILIKMVATSLTLGETP